MSRILARKAKLETVTVEAFAGLDGQGAPSYASGVDIEARVVREDAVVIGSDGSEERTTLTLYVPEGQSPMPVKQDRITVGGTDYIVRETKEAKTLKGTVDHVRARCREE